jgi:DNA-binding GntR family transcriptional regulator
MQALKFHAQPDIDPVSLTAEIAPLRAGERIRRLHESFAIRRIVERGDPEDTQELYACCDAMSLQGHDVIDLNRADERFHTTLVERANHTLLSNFWRTIQMQVRQVMAMSNRQIGDAATISQNHRNIVDAIAKGDANEAIRLLDAHVDEVIELVLQSWSEQEAS